MVTNRGPEDTERGARAVRGTKTVPAGRIIFGTGRIRPPSKLDDLLTLRHRWASIPAREH